MKKIILPILMSTMFIVPAVSHAEENGITKGHTYASEQVKEKSGWIQDKGKWYFFNEDGSMAKGWKNITGTWYYFENDGAMVSFSLKKINGKTYYFDDNGAMITG